MTSIPLFNGKPIITQDGKLGIDPSCCCVGCDKCFVNFAGVYQFAFAGTCNGNAVAFNGFLVDGTWFQGGNSVVMICTLYPPCLAGMPIEGLAIQVANANCTWEAVIPGNTQTVCFENQVPPTGVYNLLNCVDGTIGVLQVV